MSTNYLRDIGYTGLALPRRNLAPLDLLLTGGDGPWICVGAIDQAVVVDGAQIPATAEGERSPDVGGTVSRKLEVGVAVRILSSFLKAFGASAGLEARYARATEAEVAFEDVTMDYVDLAPLDIYLGNTRPNERAKNVMLWLNSGKCAIVSNVLRSRRIAISASRKNEGAVRVDTPEIAQAVEGRVKVAATDEHGSRVTFEATQGEPGVAIGFQALLLNYNGNTFSTWRPVSAGKELRNESARDATKPVEERATARTAEELADLSDLPLDDVPPPV